MIILPAIDIIDGACVRLTKGKFDTKKKYFDDPVEVAKRWKSQGAEWLHIIDLDGAKEGKTQNLDIAVKIKKETGIKVEFGGGIRDLESLEKVTGSGIDRAILGTRAIEDIDFLEAACLKNKDRVIMSIDYGKDGTVFKKGWQESAAINIFDLLVKLEALKLDELIITDISRDGTLEGSDYDFLKKILKSTKIRFILAGGIGGLEDIENIKKFESLGVSGVIVGKALYEESSNFDLKKAIMIGRA